MATRQYEDLVPKSEWKDEPEATLLTIDLPGFAKGQIKVAYVQNSKTIRVTGERSAADQKWIRFNEVFTVPKNCLVDKIHGSFANNVLTITMPKETITKMDDFPEAEEKMEKVKEKRFLEEGKRKKKVEKAKQKKNKLMEERERLTRKMEEEAKAKEKAEMMKKKLQEEEAKAKEKAEMMRKLQEEEAKAKEKAEMTRKLEEQAKGKAKEKAEMIRKLEEEAKAKEKHEEMKLPEVVYEVAKSAEEVLGYLLEKEKMMEKGGIMEKIMGKEITSEEKKKMMNVGVVALISFALGAYVSNTFCSSSSSSSSSTKPE